MTSNRPSRAACFAALVALFLLQAIPLLDWIQRDEWPARWDAAWHAMLAVHAYFSAIGTGMSTDEALTVFPIFAFAWGYYPPLVHWIGAFFHAALGPSYDAALASNVFHHLIIVASGFVIGRELRGRLAGVATAAVLSTVPHHATLAREFLLDFPLAAMTAAGFAALLVLRRDPTRARAILAGVILGAGMLTKQTYFVMIGVPAIVVGAELARGVRRREVEWRIPALVVLAALAVSSLWYSPGSLAPLAKRYIYFATDWGAVEADPAVFSAAGLGYYALTLFWGYSSLYILATLAGAIVLVRRWDGNRMAIVSLGSAIAILSFFTALHNKDSRYIAPVYVYLAPVLVVGVLSIASIRIRRAVLGVVVGLGIVQSALFAWPGVNTIWMAGPIPLATFRGKPASRAPVTPREVLGSIAEDAGARPPRVCVASANSRVNFLNATYYALRDGVPLEHLAGHEECNPLDFDYVVTGGHFLRDHAIGTHARLERHRSAFREIFRQGGVVVYRQR